MLGHGLLALILIFSAASRAAAEPQVIAVALDESYRFQLVDNPSRTDQMTVQKVFRERHAVCVVNGGFFDENFKAVGYYKVDGEVLNPHKSRSQSGYVCIDQDGDLSIHFKDVDPSEYVSVFQSGPLLVDPGGKLGIRNDDGKVADRSAIVQLGDGSFVFLFHPQTTLFALSQYILSEFPAVERAVNLDGGPEAGIATRIPALQIHENTIASKAYLVVTERSEENEDPKRGIDEEPGQ
jgi:uncharacterized protein YigE (DUF2233 family)